MLDRCVAFLLEDGFSHLSLREIAAGAGTSHRMLIYHFGSREQLLADVVGRIEIAQQEALAELMSAEPELPDVGRLFWRRLSDPSLAPAERLFFEIYAQALYERPWTAEFRASVVTSWLEPVAAMLRDRGYPPEEADRWARLGLAATRGLLLDLLVTGDHDAVDAASDLLSDLFAAAYEARGR
jgi:AcrR family transcriptional regulator